MSAEKCVTSPFVFWRACRGSQRLSNSAAAESDAGTLRCKLLEKKIHWLEGTHFTSVEREKGVEIEALDKECYA
jgi:hypothetical protein